jgi:hypothetical protein
MIHSEVKNLNNDHLTNTGIEYSVVFTQKHHLLLKIKMNYTTLLISCYPTN